MCTRMESLNLMRSPILSHQAHPASGLRCGQTFWLAEPRSTLYYCFIYTNVLYKQQPTCVLETRIPTKISHSLLWFLCFSEPVWSLTFDCFRNFLSRHNRWLPVDVNVATFGGRAPSHAKICYKRTNNLLSQTLLHRAIIGKPISHNMQQLAGLRCESWICLAVNLQATKLFIMTSAT